MSFRPTNYDIWHDFTLIDMWYGVARDIFVNGFLQGGGIPHVCESQAIEMMANEFYKTAERYRLKGPLSVSGSYKLQYNRLQSSRTYTDIDMELWEDTIWSNIVDRVADVVSTLEQPDTSWLPDQREMHHLHPDVVMGMLWAIAHIPSKNERNHVDMSDGDYESDG